jgi:hypothetical protein
MGEIEKGAPGGDGYSISNGDPEYTTDVKVVLDAHVVPDCQFGKDAILNEQLNPRPVPDTASIADPYSLGVSDQERLTDERPFPDAGEQRSKVKARHPPPIEVRESVVKLHHT